MQTKGLTLEQAVKSGQPFRHEDWKVRSTDWFKGPTFDLCKLTVEEAISKRWEIKKETYTTNEVERLVRKGIEAGNNSKEYLDSMKRTELVLKIMNGEPV